MRTLDQWVLGPSGLLELRWIDGAALPARETRQPGADLSDLPQDVRDAAAALWTPAFVADWHAEHNPPPGPPTVPAAVTARQARLALDAAGLLDTVEAAIAELPRAERIEWEYASEIRRDHPLIASLAAALSLTAADVDALFTTARGL